MKIEINNIIYKIKSCTKQNSVYNFAKIIVRVISYVRLNNIIEYKTIRYIYIYIRTNIIIESF